MKWFSTAVAFLVGVVPLNEVFAAPAPNVGAYRDAIVRVNCGPKCWGTGFFVSAVPPVVATCYHVIKRRESVSVTLKGETEFTAAEIAAYPSQDIAFIKLKDFGSWSRTINWDRNASASTGQGLSYYGLSRFRVNSLVPGDATFAAQSLLEALGGPQLLPVRLPKLSVIELAKGLPEPKAGDSGGPVFNDRGELIGMIAGMARQYGNDIRIYFGVGLAVDVPGPDDPTWRSSVWVDDDAYASADITKLVTPLVREPTAFTDPLLEEARSDPNDAACAIEVENVIASFRGKLDLLPRAADLPKEWPVKLSAECAARYEQSRPFLENYEHKGFTGAKAEVVLATVTTEAIDEKIALNKELIAAAETKSSEQVLASAVTGLRSSGLDADKVKQVETSLGLDRAAAPANRGQSEIGRTKQTQNELMATRTKVLAVRQQATEVTKLSEKEADLEAKQALIILKGEPAKNSSAVEK